MDISTPLYNFIRFDNNLLILPIEQSDTICFQVRIDDIGVSNDWSVSLRDTDTNNIISVSDIAIVKEGILLNISFAITGTIAYNKKYKVRLSYDDGNGLPENFDSNFLMRPFYQTTYIEYTHFEDFLEFGYETATPLVNKVRLPIRFYNNTPTTVTEQYQKSDGQFVSFGNFITDIYSVETPFLNSDYHRCIQAMLLHRTIKASINNLVHTIQLSENYVSEYPENNNYGFSKGKAKVSTSLI